MKKGNNSYTNEFRRETADLVNKQGYTVAEAAKNLGVHPKTLSNWVKKYGGINLNKSTQSMRTELIHLRKENKKLRLEREILKNAAAFFAKELG